MKKTEFHPLTYSATELEPGWVHIGMGNFARAFVARFAHDVAAAGIKDFGLVGVAPSDTQKIDLQNLKKQSGYHIVELNGHKNVVAVDPWTQFMIGAEQSSEVMRRVANSRTQVVSTTITADGYCRKSDGSLTAEALKDAEYIRAEKWDKVAKAPGWIAGGLYQRFLANQEPPVVMSCDNIIGNGNMMKSVLNQFAQAIGNKAFVAYVNEKVLTPNTAVDRVTPKQNWEKQADELTSHLPHIRDRYPVVTEQHRELVIEQTKNRPLPQAFVDAFSKAGAHIVQDIKSAEEAKIGVFNGGHMLFGVNGTLLQVTTVPEAMQHKQLSAFANHFLHQAGEGLAPTQTRDIHAYIETSKERFRNNVDNVDRLRANTTGKIWDRAVNKHALKDGKAHDASAFFVASWATMYLRGRDVSGNHFTLHENDRDTLKQHELYVGGPNFGDKLVKFFGAGRGGISEKAMSVYVGDVEAFGKKILRDGLKNSMDQQFSKPYASRKEVPGPVRKDPDPGLSGTAPEPA